MQEFVNFWARLISHFITSEVYIIHQPPSRLQVIYWSSKILNRQHISSVQIQNTFLKILKKSGPKCDPIKTLKTILKILDFIPLRNTWNEQSFKYEHSHRNIVSWKPEVESFFNSTLCDTWWKALPKSVSITSVWLPSLTHWTTMPDLCTYISLLQIHFDVWTKNIQKDY